MATRLPIVLVLLLGACAHTDVSLNAGSTSRSASGTSVVSSSAGLQVNAGGAAAAVIAAGIVAAATLASADNPPPRRYLSVSDWLRNEPAPEMAADRAVSEQDCTKPINPGGNLRCR